MSNNAYIEKIHRYLQGKMDSRESGEFELEMSKNDQLKQDVLLEKELLTGLELAGDDDLRSDLAQARKNLESEGFFTPQNKIVPIHPLKKKINMNRIIAIAAVAIALLGLAWWAFLRPFAPDTDAIFAAHFQPEKTKAASIMAGFPSAFAGEHTAQDSLREALRLYEEGEYNKSCAALDSFLMVYPENDTAAFYLAMAHLNADRYARSVEILTGFDFQESSVFHYDAQWYLGLCYLKVEEGLPKAREIFSDLAADAGYRDRQAADGLLRLIGND